MVQGSLFTRPLEPDNRTGTIPRYPDYLDPENPIPSPPFPYDQADLNSLEPPIASQLLYQLQYGDGVIPAELRQKIVERFSQKDATIGRPDLANPGGTNTDARKVLDAVDELNKKLLFRRPDNLVKERAEILLQDKEALERTILNKYRLPRVYGNMTDDEVLAAQKYIAELAPLALTGNDEMLKKVSVMEKAIRATRGEVGRALRMMRDTGMSPMQRHLEFITATILTPRGRVKLRKPVIPMTESGLGDMRDSNERDSVIRFLMSQLGILNQALAEQRGKAATPGEGQTILVPDPQAEATIRELEEKIAEVQAQLDEVRSQLTTEELELQEARRQIQLTNETLAKLGTSLEQLMFETSLAQLRDTDPAKVMGQMFNSVRMTKREREAMERIVLEYDANEAARDAGITIQRVGELMASLREEAKRRFKRLSEAGMTRSQLREALRRYAETGQSLMARPFSDDDNTPLTPEEAMEEIYGALGIVLKPGKSTQLRIYDRKGRTNLFDLRKREHAYVLARAAVESNPTLDSVFLELYASSLFSGLLTQVVNVATTPASPFYLAATRGFETMFSALTRNLVRPEIAPGFTPKDLKPFNIGETTIQGEQPLISPESGTPYTIPEATRAWLEEGARILRAVFPAAISSYGWYRLAWETEAGFFISATRGLEAETPLERIGGERGVARLRRRIPDKYGGRQIRTFLRFMLAADEFSKSFRAHIQVGSIAYQLGHMAGLRGDALSSFIEREVSSKWMDDTTDQPSLSWQIAAERADKETLTSRLEQNMPEVKSIGGGITALTAGALQRMTNIVSDMREATADSRIGLAARIPLALLQTFFLIIRTPFNIQREGLANSPLAWPNVASIYFAQGHRKPGKVMRTMTPEQYVLYRRRGGQALLGTLMSVIIAGAVEGDEDDDEKWFLVTGSPLKKPGQGDKTRFGNTPYTIRLGGTTLDYGRIEPLATALGNTSDFVRAIKEGGRGIVQNSEGAVARAVRNIATDTALAPLTKTYGKQFRDLARTFETSRGTPGALNVARDRAQIFLSWPLWRKIVESFDPYVRDATIDPTSTDAILYTLWPTAGNIPPRRDYEGNPIRKEGTTLSRMLVPGRGKYKTPEKSPLMRYVSAYNAKFPDDRWDPRLPDKNYTDPITGETMIMSGREYDTAIEIARGAVANFVFTTLPPNAHQKPTPEMREKLQSGIARIYSKAKQQVVLAAARRRAEEIAGGTKTRE